MKEKTVSEAIAHRRSVRVYDPEKPIDTQKVKYCIEQASLAPTSSNLQLWEFYHVTSPELKKEIAKNCYNQPAAKTAQELVIPVVRLDLWKERIQSNVDFIRSNVKTPEDEAKIKGALTYYQKIIPNLYRGTSFWRGAVHKLKANWDGMRKVSYREVTSGICGLWVIKVRLWLLKILWSVWPLKATTPVLWKVLTPSASNGL
jgi:nitroreductase